MHDATTALWQVWVAGRVLKITVDGYPTTQPPALATLYERLTTLHQAPQASSVWRVWVAGQVVERTANCNVASVPTLRPLFQALFAPHAGAAGEPTRGRSPTLNADTLLVEIIWKEHGKVIEQTRVYGDGRQIKLTTGQEELESTFTAEQLTAIRQAIQETNFSSLPDPVCG